jgi:hypothetical protein
MGTHNTARSLYWIKPSIVLHVDAISGEITRMHPNIRKVSGKVVRKVVQKDDVTKEWISKLGSMYNERVVICNGEWNGGRNGGLVSNGDTSLWNPWILYGHSCGALLQMNSTVKYVYDEAESLWRLHTGQRRSQIAKPSVKDILGISPFLLRSELRGGGHPSSTSSSSTTTTITELKFELVLDERQPSGTLYSAANNNNVPIDAVSIHHFGPVDGPSLICSALRCGVVVLMIKDENGKSF